MNLFEVLSTFLNDPPILFWIALFVAGLNWTFFGNLLSDRHKGWVKQADGERWWSIKNKKAIFFNGLVGQFVSMVGAVLMVIACQPSTVSDTALTLVLATFVNGVAHGIFWAFTAPSGFKEESLMMVVCSLGAAFVTLLLGVFSMNGSETRYVNDYLRGVELNQQEPNTAVITPQRVIWKSLEDRTLWQIVSPESALVFVTVETDDNRELLNALREAVQSEKSGGRVPRTRDYLCKVRWEKVSELEGFKVATLTSIERAIR